MVFVNQMLANVFSGYVYVRGFADLISEAWPENVPFLAVFFVMTSILLGTAIIGVVVKKILSMILIGV